MTSVCPHCTRISRQIDHTFAKLSPNLSALLVDAPLDRLPAHQGEEGIQRVVRVADGVDGHEVIRDWCSVP